MSEGDLIPPFAEIDGWRAFVYADDHGVPHFHLRRAGQSVPVAIEDGHILSGNLPSHTHRAVVAWLEEHRGAAMDAWNAVREGRLPRWVE